MEVEKTVFRAYDIRGVYGRTIDENLFEAIGNVVSRFLGSSLIVGMDCRISSPALKDAFIKGARKAGINIIDVGLVPRGATSFWSWKRGIPCAYISASHLPLKWNGIKFVRHDGTNLLDKNEVLADMIINNEFVVKEEGSLEKVEILDEYEKHLAENIPQAKRPLRVLLDCGNGTAGLVVERVFRRMGYEPEVLFGEPDGRFPNRASEITPDAIKKAREMSRNFDITLAFDGDADRLAALDNHGNFIQPETLACIIMKELLKNEKGDVYANVECSKVVDHMAEKFGKKVQRTPVGYTFLLNALIAGKGCFGVEKSMHFCIPSVMPFDDAIIAALYAAYSVSVMETDLGEFVKDIPVYTNRQVKYECSSDAEKINAMERIKARVLSEYPGANTMDGVRVDFNNGWVLIRQSNTEPVIRLSVEADTDDDLERLKERFEKVVKEEIGSTESF